MSKDDQNELDFLRFFFKEVRPALGPADDDIVSAICAQWVDEGNELPPEYK